MEPNTEKTLKALERNGFHAYYAESGQAACDVICELIPKSCSIGVGDSASVRQLELLKRLREEGRILVDPVCPLIVEQLNAGNCDRDQHRRLQWLSLQCDYYLTGTNALTVGGVILNTDAAGNRIAGMCFGPQHVVLVVGVNKLVDRIEDGIRRIRTCCAPVHACTKQRKTPCTVTGTCMDCNSAERICRVTSIIERKPSKTDISVVIVNQDLGLGWEADWDPQRIEAIQTKYIQATSVRRPEWVTRKG